MQNTQKALTAALVAWLCFISGLYVGSYLRHHEDTSLEQTQLDRIKAASDLHREKLKMGTADEILDATIWDTLQ